MTVNVQSVYHHYVLFRPERTRGARLLKRKCDCRGGAVGALAKVSLSRPSSSRSVANDVSDLESMIEAKVTDICAVDRNR